MPMPLRGPRHSTWPFGRRRWGYFYFASRHRGPSFASPSAEATAEKPRWVLTAIQASDGLRVSIDDAAAMAFLSPSRFAHLFKHRDDLSVLSASEVCSSDVAPRCASVYDASSSFSSAS